MVQVRSTQKMKLGCRDSLDHVQSVMKTKKDNGMIDCIGVVYAKTEIELS